jgi:hypothetical protein
MDPRRAVIFLRPDGLRGFRKLVLGGALEGSSPTEIVARVDPAPDVPPFTLAEDDVPRLFDAVVANLRDFTGK